MAATYQNLITTRDVSLAIQQFLIAPYGTTTWVASSGKVNVSSPPSGFRSMGAVDEESPQITVTRNKFQLRTGIPQVLQYQAVTSLEAQIQFSLHTRDTRKALYALGSSSVAATEAGGNGALYLAPASLTLIASVGSAGQITLAASPALPWYVGDEIVTSATSAGWATSQNYAVISSISGAVVTVDPPFATTPVITPGVVAKPLAIRNAFGTSIVRDYTIMGVADFIDGYQLVHYFNRCQPSAEFTEQLRASQNERLNFQFDVFGVDGGATYNNELIVGERYLYQK